MRRIYVFGQLFRVVSLASEGGRDTHTFKSRTLVRFSNVQAILRETSDGTSY